MNMNTSVTGVSMVNVLKCNSQYSSDKFTRCPYCEQEVRRLISLVSVNTPKGNSDLKNMGFTKLVKRDNGVYENVTATGKESRYWDAGKPETRPDLKSKISD